MSTQHFEKITAQDNTRVHVGNSYDYSTHNHNHGTLRQDEPLAGTATEKAHLLKALTFPRMDHRQATITTASPESCQWLFATPQYVRWHDANFRLKTGTFLWIKGKPGAGKSTIMKALHRSMREVYPNRKIVSFYFNARGEPLERSVEGMYRALVYQMAKDVPAPRLEKMVSLGALESYAKSGWPLELLKDLYREAVVHCSRMNHLSCFVDALDEGEVEDDIRDMIDHFTEIANSRSPQRLGFSICFASRHYPNISNKFCEELVLEKHQGHRESIAHYVETKLRLSSQTLEQELGSEIRQRSAGVFLWVVLVVRILNTEADRGNHHHLREKLQSTLPRVNDLIRDIMRKDKDERLLPAMQWVLFSRRPLTADELYSAIVISTGHAGVNMLRRDCGLLDSERAKAVRSFILSSTKGLVEITTSSDRMGNIERSSVQFIHETVREYFLQCGMQELDPSLARREDFNALCHERLAKWCHDYFQIAVQHFSRHQLSDADLKGGQEIFCESALASWPLLQYSLNEMLRHAELAADYGNISHLVEQTILSGTWMTLKSYLSPKFDATAFLPKPTAVLVFAQEGHDSLVIAQLDEYRKLTRSTQHALVNLQTEKLGSALHVAAMKGKYEVAQALIDDGADVDACSAAFQTPLYVAARTGNTAIVDILLRHHANVHPIQEESEGPLHAAIRHGSLSVATKLLLHGAGQNAAHRGNGSALRLAASCGNNAVVEALLSDGVNVNANLENGCTALHAASDGPIPLLERHRIFEILLSQGADVNAQCAEHGTALHMILHEGEWSTDTVQLLIKYGAVVNLFCGQHGTPLNTAISKRYPFADRTKLLSFLLAHAKSLSEPIGEHGNLVQTAGKMNDFQAMYALMNNGVNVNANDFSATGPYENFEVARRSSHRWGDCTITEFDPDTRKLNT